MRPEPQLEPAAQGQATPIQALQSRLPGLLGLPAHSKSCAGPAGTPARGAAVGRSTGSHRHRAITEGIKLHAVEQTFTAFFAIRLSLILVFFDIRRI